MGGDSLRKGDDKHWAKMGSAFGDLRAMVPKLLTRWYGNDRWPETDATFMSCEEVFHHEGQEGGPSASARFAFYYRDLSGSIQSGHIHVDDESPLYTLKENDAFRIQFNSQKPSKYYCREAATFYSQVPFVSWSLMGLGLLCFLVIWLIRNIAR